MHFQVVDRISLPSPSAAVNEDAIGATDKAAWVIDGATGVSDLPPLVPGLTDAAWLAAQLNDRLYGAFERAPIEPHTSLAGIDADIRAEFTKTNELEQRTTVEQPTAAFALSVLAGGTLHLMGLGDCRIVYQDVAGQVQEFNPSETARAEAVIVQERSRLIAAHPGEDPWPRLKSFIRSFREFANVEGGYSIVHPTLTWSTRLKRQAHDAKTVSYLLAVSDGFYRLVDIFKAVSGPDQLLKRAQEDGLMLLCSELRELEMADDRCITYPRVKTFDDASALLLRVA